MQLSSVAVVAIAVGIAAAIMPGAGAGPVTSQSAKPAARAEICGASQVDMARSTWNNKHRGYVLEFWNCDNDPRNYVAFTFRTTSDSPCYHFSPNRFGYAKRDFKPAHILIHWAHGTPTRCIGNAGRIVIAKNVRAVAKW